MTKERATFWSIYSALKITKVFQTVVHAFLLLLHLQTKSGDKGT